MTELETVLRAKMYMDKLSQGIDPITDQRLPGDTALNNERLSRCFAYVSGILGQVARNGGVVGQKVRTLEFSLTPQQRETVQLSTYPVRITEFIDTLYMAANNPDMKRLSVRRLNDWLEKKGFMKAEPGPDGKNRRVPTDSGTRLGMTTQMRQSPDGEYLAVYYSYDAQRYMLQSLDEIIKE